MNIYIDFINFFPYKEWWFYYKRFKYCKGISFRLFGINIRIIEKNATQKLIDLGNKTKTI